MQSGFYLIIFLFGLIVGSFLNSIIYRLPTGESVLFKRSHCPQCKRQLGWQDLIPLLSFLILKGRCRYCKKPISWQYPLIELATGLSFMGIFWISDFSSLAGGGFFLFRILITAFLIIIFTYDLKHYVIPDRVIYPAIVITLIFNLQFLISKQFSIFNYSILSAILAAAFFLTIVLISRGKWMGGGDVKLVFLIGLFLGWPNVSVALFLAFFIGAIIGLGLVAGHKKNLRSEIPFGPFLVTGTFIALIWGQNIINWYLRLFC